MLFRSAWPVVDPLGTGARSRTEKGTECDMATVGATLPGGRLFHWAAGGSGARLPQARGADDGPLMGAGGHLPPGALHPDLKLQAPPLAEISADTRR